MELNLHDRDKGLFKNILIASYVIEGRYHISPDYGFNLNTDNLDQFFKDEKYGLTQPDQKYPMVICMPPRSFLEQGENGPYERLVYEMYFLTRHNYEGNGQVKMLDPQTKQSGHHAWYDWYDMKRCADGFTTVLKKLLKNPITTAKLGGHVRLDEDAHIPCRRIYLRGNDLVNGVSIIFNIITGFNDCSSEDYSQTATILEGLPDYKNNPLHPQHKH